MLTIKQQINLKELYEFDEYQWLMLNIDLLKTRNLKELDLENLIEELEDLGSEKRHAVESLLEKVIIHLLLIQYWTQELEFNETHWKTEIIAFRNQLERKLTTNLRYHLAEKINSIYKAALRYVKQKTNYQIKELPEKCPYTLEQLLDFDWYCN